MKSLKSLFILALVFACGCEVQAQGKSLPKPDTSSYRMGKQVVKSSTVDTIPDRLKGVKLVGGVKHDAGVILQVFCDQKNHNLVYIVASPGGSSISVKNSAAPGFRGSLSVTVIHQPQTCK